MPRTSLSSLALNVLSQFAASLSSGSTSGQDALGSQHYTISGNSSALRGGIFNAEGGLVEVSGSTISGNRVLFGFGAGIYNEQGGKVIVTDSTFHNNEAGDFGGGVFDDWGGKVEVEDSTFSINHASDTGGGIFNSGALSVTSSTFSANDSDVTCGLTRATGSLPNTNPLLDPAGLRDNGGPTQTIALQPGSPAVDLVGQDARPPQPTSGEWGVRRGRPATLEPSS